MSRKKRRSKGYVPPSVQARMQRKQAEAKSAATKRQWLIGGAVLVLIIVSAVLWFTVGPGKPTPPYEPPIERNGMYSAPPEMQIDSEKDYFATISTSKGDIVLMLFADEAPVTVNNFVFLAREGFYDNTTFHRVLAGFMAQAGDPTGTGSGGPGYKFADELSPELRHDSPGILSMANSGPGTNGSQFFITYEPTPWLDGYDETGAPKNCADPQISCHTVFGQVIEGMDVLESLTPRDPTQSPGFYGDIIETITITEE